MLFGNEDKYGGRNLLFQDDTSNLIPLEENKQTFKGYLGKIIYNNVNVPHPCNIF